MNKKKERDNEIENIEQKLYKLKNEKENEIKEMEDHFNKNKHQLMKKQMNQIIIIMKKKTR